MTEVRVDNIDVRDVHYVEDKITYTMGRINKFRKWQPRLKNYVVKSWCLYKLRKQLDFLIRVNNLKAVEVVNDAT